MSRTTTSRPSYVNQRGRGKGANRNPPQSTTSETSSDLNRDNRHRQVPTGRTRSIPRPTSLVAGRGQSRSNNHLSRNTGNVRMSGTDPYGDRSRPTGAEPNNSSNDSQRHEQAPPGMTVISPNEKKRNKITEIARKEEEAYAEHVRQKTQKSYSYVGPVGGHGTSERVSRLKQLQSQRSAKVDSLEKQKQLKSETKRKEQEEIDAKLAKARQQAEKNEERKREEIKKSENKWDEDRRRKNDKFLKKLENQPSLIERNPPEKIPTVSSKTVKETPQLKKSPERTLKNKHVSSNVRTTSLDEPQGAEGPGTEVRQTDNESESESAEPVLGYSPEQLSTVFKIQDIFPQYGISEIIPIAEQTDFSLERAVDLLSGF